MRILLFSLAITTACAPGPGSEPTRVRDSAGVRIVESRTSAWSPNEQWRVDTAPLMSIGAEEGDERYLLSLVRSVLRLTDGRIVVGDGGSRQVRFYDSTGRFLQGIGGPGQGPGEFGTWVLRLWDKRPSEIWANDDANGRINVIDLDGSFRGSVRIVGPPVAPRASAVGLFADGSILATATLGSRHTEPVGRPGDIHHPGRVFLRYSADGQYLGELLRYSGQPEYGHVFLGSTTFSPIPLTQGAVAGIVGNGLAIYRGSGSDIEIWTQDGERKKVIRWSGGPVRLVSGVWERYKVESLRRPGLTELGRQLYGAFHELPPPLPERLPAFDALMSDVDGQVWARRYRLLWETEQVWEVFSADGAWLGTVVTPEGLTVYQLGADFVLGVHRDESDVERVRLYTLRKP